MEQCRVPANPCPTGPATARRVNRTFEAMLAATHWSSPLMILPRPFASVRGPNQYIGSRTGKGTLHLQASAGRPTAGIPSNPASRRCYPSLFIYFGFLQCRLGHEFRSGSGWRNISQRVRRSACPTNRPLDVALKLSLFDVTIVAPARTNCYLFPAQHMPYITSYTSIGPCTQGEAISGTCSYSSRIGINFDPDKLMPHGLGQGTLPEPRAMLF